VDWKKAEPRKVNIMSGRKFWANGRSNPLEREQAPGDLAPAEMLTVVDRCDRCGARAYVRVLLPSRLELLFCAHHNRQYASALKKIAIAIQDETHRLAPAVA
jgi:hypothetical protein